ncbi:MAG: MoxR family ATPase [Bacteroidia bacterium]|nr:MoxR family ATPase [Bacteroidia bacterium]
MDDFERLCRDVARIKSEVAKVLVGREPILDLLLTAILADGHSLIEGVPGVAKTLSVKLLAKTLALKFGRVQFTPDLMPSDVLGTNVFNLKTSEFEFKRGPIFCSFLLADEINRAPAKTQSALFEVMEERQATIDGTTYAMERPFLVFATQNPIEHEGTYRLPEAQLDRFMFLVEAGYPDLDEEVAIMEGAAAREEVQIEATLDAHTLIAHQRTVRKVRAERSVVDYIARLVRQTRVDGALFLGASPRASLAILAGAKAVAAMQGRDFITPDDVRFVAVPALRHRVILTAEKELQGMTPVAAVKNIVERVEVPR